MRSSALHRTKILLTFLIFFAVILLGKLFYVQIVHSSSYSDRADRQYATPTENIFERGTIFFTRKDGQLVSAAMQTSGFKLAIDPTKLTSIDEIYGKLNGIVSIPKDEFMTKAKKKNDPYEEVAMHLTKEEADVISALKLTGVSIFKEKWRFYPGDVLASHTLGFVGYKGNELGGRYGLERQYNQELSRNTDNPYVNFFAEVFSNINDALFSKDEREGNVVTTIEPAVQSFLETKLLEVSKRYNTDSIGGIIMNPTDGSIYAMGVKPDFNPNEFGKVKNVSVFTNPLVENVLEFGSVVKPLIMAAGINEGVVTPATKYEDKGSVVVEKKEIFNFDKKARGVVTMQDVLNQSLNTGMVLVEQKLGRARLKEYLLSYQIDKKTGIDLPNETSGLVSNLNSPREIEFANASFGQGIAMTPIEMVRALAVLPNGGKLVTPHVVREIKYADGTSKKLEFEEEDTKLSLETTNTITNMLVTVMDKAIQSGNGKLENYSIAVKTGTAQVANPQGGGYYEDRHTHSFFGYFPAYDPQFIVLLYAVNPKGSEYAATTWSNPFLDTAKFLLNYYEVAPDR